MNVDVEGPQRADQFEIQPHVHLGAAGHSDVSEVDDGLLRPIELLIWVGFDVWLALMLLRVAWYAWRRDPNVVLAAAVAGTLLAVDAWFDIMTAGSGPDRWAAIASAVLLEIPGALLCGTLAYRGLHLLLVRAAQEGRVPDRWNR